MVKTPQTSYSVRLSGSVTLTCTVSADPSHDRVFWNKLVNGVFTQVTMVTRYSGSTVQSPSLTITNAEQSDKGDYVRYASNSIGTGNSQQVNLDVTGGGKIKNKYFCENNALI